MQKVDIQAWLAGGLPASAGAVGVDQVASRVFEYTSAAAGTTETPFQTPVRDRRAEAASTPVAMTRAMQGKYAGRAMVMALHDRIGIVQEIVHARNVFEGRIGELNASQARQLFVASAIENLKADFAKRGKQQEWAQKYEPAYAAGDVAAFKSSYMSKYEPLEASRNAYSKMWCDWMGQPGIGKVLASLNNRYHPNSAMDCVNQMRTLADMLNGTGRLSAEAALWQQWMGQSAVNKDNLLDRAVSGGNASLLAFLTTRKDAALPNVVDAFKSLYTAVDEWEKSNQAHFDYIRKASQGLVPKGLDPREWAVRRGEALFEGLHKFYQTMAGNVAQLKAGAAKHVRHAVVAGILYFNVRFKPVTQSLLASELATDLKETRWGIESAKKPVIIESTPTRQIYLLNTTEFMDLVAVDSKRITMVSFVVAEERTPNGLWVPAGNRTVGGIILPEGFVPSSPTRVNSFLVAKQWAVSGLKGGGTALGFSALVLFFQFKAIEDSWQTLGDPKASDQAQNDARLALIGAAIGAGGALMEGSAAAWQLAKGGTALPMMTRLAAGGGILGAISSAVAAWQTGASALRAREAGDSDTATLMGVAAITLGVAAAAGGFGAAATMTPVVLALTGVGPVGWAVIAIGAIVVSVALLFGAGRLKDDPLEAWLKQCLYGIAPERFNEKDEVVSFNKIFELPLSAKIEYDEQLLGARHLISASVAIPRLQGRRQRFEVVMTITKIDGGDSQSRVQGVISDIEQVQKVLAPGQTPQQLQQLETVQSELARKRLLFEGTWTIDAEATTYALSREVEFNNLMANGSSRPFLSRATLEVKYWPDESANPDIVLPVGGGPGGAPVRVTVPQ